MKKFLRKSLFLPVFILASLLPAKATHIIGGDITVKSVGSNNFEITLTLFFDCINGSPGAFDPIANVGIFDKVTNTMQQAVAIPFIDSTTLILDDTCYTPTTLCVRQQRYVDTTNIPNNPNGYYLSWIRCCRNGFVITNIANPSASGNVFYAEISDPALLNSSPTFLLYPDTYMCQGVPNADNFSATDVDGDSLVYSFSNPLDCATNGQCSNTNPNPGAAPGPYGVVPWLPPYTNINMMGDPAQFIDFKTGFLSTTPPTQGVFLIGVKVEEFRNNVKIGEVRRDLQYAVLNCNIPTITVNIAGPNPICLGQSTTLVATGGTNYSWNTGATTSTIIVTPSATGTHTFSVYHIINNSCRVYADTVITVYLGTTVAASGFPTSICMGQNTTLSVTGTGTYQWSPGGSLNNPTSANPIASPSITTTYTVTLTNNVGCIATDTVTITVPPGLLSINSTPSGCSSCTGTSTASTSGGIAPYTYTWSTIPVQSTATATGLCGGTIYTVTVTDASGCTTSTTSQTVSITVTPTGSLSTNSNPSACSSCIGKANANTFGGTAPYTYSWSTIPVQNTPTATGLCGGTSYTVTSTDANGCTTSKTVPITFITSSGSLNTTSTPSSCTSCTGTSSASTSGGTAPYTYIWNTIPAQNTAIATGLCGGVYTVTSTDANGCTTSKIVSINSGNVAITVLSAPVSCFGACDGIASVSVFGGTPPYTYSWNTSPVQTTQVVAGLCAGTYILTVADVIGCVSANVVPITQPASALAANPTSTSASCGTCPDGTTSANATGGTSPYTYSWTPSGQTTAIATGLFPGTYTVCVTDTNGCTQCDSVTVNFSTTTGTTEIPSEKNISVYPNPATELITMELNFETQMKVEISVCNMLGEQIYSETIEARQTKKIIPVAKLPGGIYFIQAKTDSGIFVKKFIRQ